MRSQRGNAVVSARLRAASLDGVPKDATDNGSGAVLVLFDAECRRCRWIAGWLAGHSDEGELAFRPLQDAAALRRAGVDASEARAAIHAIDTRRADGRVERGDAALLMILSRLPAFRRWRRIAHGRTAAVVTQAAYWILTRSRRRKHGCC